MNKQHVTILGSTGTIGKNTLDVISRNAEQFAVTALAANQNAKLLFEQVSEFRPKYAAMASEAAAEELEKQIRKSGLDTEILAGEEGVRAVAGLKEADTVVAGIVGAAGLMPALSAIRAGKRLLLANKEALVMAGALFMAEVKESGATIIPLDSEHNAIFQCMHGGSGSLREQGIRKLYLTASGGPFLRTPIDQLRSVTPEQACAHPRWVMGRKISVDCATMMNKGLEVIEASWLFNAPPEEIGVVIHPQSIVHSMVEYLDGSVLAHLSPSDMRVPIAAALAWPGRIESGVTRLDPFTLQGMEFLPPDSGRFPCLKLAYDALRKGGTAPAVLNAANEVAVEAFLERRLAFPEIFSVVQKVLEKASIRDSASLDVVIEADRTARIAAKALIPA